MRGRGRHREGRGICGILGRGLPGLLGGAGNRRRGRSRDWGCRAVLLADHGLKVAEVLGLDIETPLEVAAHLALHLVDLAQGEHALADDAPRLVRVRVVANNFRGDHKRRDIEPMARRATGSGEAVLEAREQVERAKGDRGMEAGAVERIGDKVRERRGHGRLGCCGGHIGAREEVRDKPCAHLCSIFMAIVLVRRGLRGLARITE